MRLFASLSDVLIGVGIGFVLSAIVALLWPRHKCPEQQI